MMRKSRQQAKATTPEKPAADEKWAPLVSPKSEAPAPSRSETLHRLYVSLLRSRRMQEFAQASSDWASAYQLSIGHEAMMVGAAAELSPADTVTASRRNLAALVAGGASPKELFSPRCNGPWRASTPLVPEDPFHAGAGIALAHKLEKKGNVVVAFCDQRNVSLDAWREALKFSAAHRLPIIFILESEPEAENTHHLEDVSFTVRDVDMPGVIVDGSDVVAVWRVAHEGIHRARYGSGPTFIDCRTDPARDPLAHMQRYLEKRHEWDDGWHRQLESEIEQDLLQLSASLR